MISFMVMEIIVSLGLIKSLEPEEIMAAFLHEFGHNIDPANVSIEYTEVNILSKYFFDIWFYSTVSKTKYLHNSIFKFLKWYTLPI